MNKKKVLIISLKSLLISLLLIFIFYFITYLFVGEKKELTNNYSSFSSYEGFYLSRISDEFEAYLDSKNIKIDDISLSFLELNNEKINDNGIIFSYWEKSNKDYLYNVKQAITKKYGGNFDLLNNIDVKNSDGDILLLHINNESLLPATFDFNKEKTLWGVNESSSSTLTNLLKVNYVKDDNNYCLSVVDTLGNEIIFMKDDSFRSYEDAWKYYIKNKNSLNKFNYGEDSAIFKVININQIGLIPELTNYKYKNLSIENYYISLMLKINGLGKVSNDDKNVLDQSKIKYNFSEDTILFIVKENELTPFLAYKY